MKRHCPPWLADHAEDLVQKALLKVMDRLSAEAPPSASYLWRVAYSVVIDEIRVQRRRREIGAEECQSEPVSDRPYAQPEQRARAAEIRRAMNACLDGMLETRRGAVVLYLQGHTVPEVARLLGWSTKKAENSVYRGLSDLRGCLTKKGVSP